MQHPTLESPVGTRLMRIDGNGPANEVLEVVGYSTISEDAPVIGGEKCLLIRPIDPMTNKIADNGFEPYCIVSSIMCRFKIIEPNKEPTDAMS